jgi:hypothetical protein
MAEIKSSGSSKVEIPSDSAVGVFGPWTALFMGVNQATHPITFDSSWALLVMGVDLLIGTQHDVEIGVGPTSPPAETVWGPMKFYARSTGGGRGTNCNYSFPLKLSAGDQLWARCRKVTGAVGIQEILLFLTVSDQFQPVRPATVHLSTTVLFQPVGGFINAPTTPAGVRFPGDNLLGLWYEMTTPNEGLGFNASWLSICADAIQNPTLNARWQLGAVQPGEGSPPNLPELIDVGFTSLGGGFGGIHVSVMADVMNFPIPWEKGDSVWIRGAVFREVNANPVLNFIDFKIAATFWGNP